MGLDMYFHEKDTKYHRNDFAYARAYPIHEFLMKEAQSTNGDVYYFEISPELFKKLLLYMKHDSYIISGILDYGDYEELKPLLLIPCDIDSASDCFVRLGNYYEELQNLIRDLSKIDIDKTKVCYSGDY